MKIRQKLFIGFLSILVIICVISAVSGYVFFKTLSVNNKIQDLLFRDMLLDEAVRDHLVWTGELSNMLLLDAPFTGELDPRQCRFGQWYYAFTSGDSLLKDLHNSLEGPHLALHDSATEIIAHYNAGEKEEATNIYAKKTILYMQIIQSQALRLSQRSMVVIAGLKKQHQNMESFLMWVTFLVPVAAFLLALLISVIISRRITVPLKQVIEKIKSFSVFRDGPLIEFSENSNDELSELGYSFNQLVRELQETREKMTAVADPLFSVDNEFIITYFSDAASQVTGYAKGEALGKRCSEVLKSDLCQYDCVMKIVLKKGEPLRNIEGCIRTKAGKPLSILISAAALKDYSGKVTGGIEVFKDISVLKTTLRELEQTRDKLSRTERLGLLGQLTGGLAHELNTPLARIKLTLEYLKRVKLEDAQKEIRVGMKIISNDVIECERVISNILSFARSKTPITEEVDLNSIIPLVLDKLEYFEHLKDIKVTLNLNKTIPKIIADNRQIKLVLLNVIRNAAEAMKNKGFLNIETSAQANFVQVNIKDTGPGIAPDDSQTIFEPLYSTKPGGSGLGLAVSATIVKAHNGSIEAKSEQGKGTEIIIKLPFDFTLM
ncbi:MAG: ATP-binding protein [Candidatus Omnitrophica bacterium]|nr:ATP-binding protein [Candidatus Omnitrophota bacterium]